MEASHDPQASRAVVAAALADAGLDAWGIAPAVFDASADVAEHRIHAAIAAGRHGNLAYLERHAPQKLHPESLLPGCRSVITIAFPFLQGDADVPPGHGRLARYAWGRRYHDIAKDRLRGLAAVLAAAFPGHRFVPGYDDTPLAEKHYAVRAGLGFLGKHGLVIHPRAGSWIVLGEILGTLELPADAPGGAPGSGCGACTRCLDACPSNAFPAPFTLDAGRCVSYLTIEGRRPVPDPLKPGLGDRLFGCDACQEACPHNAATTLAALPDFGQRVAGPSLPLADVLTVADDEDLKRRWPGSPLLRAHRPGLVRNACLAAANTGRTELLPLIEALTDDDDAGIADAARWATARLAGTGGPDAAPVV